MFQLDEKTAVVTGAGSGIGEAIARLFAAHGARVVLLDVNEDAARRVADSIRSKGAMARALVCDVSKRAEVEAAARTIAAEEGSVHILVNNAGVGHVGNVESTTDADFDRLFSINVRGVYLGTQAFIGGMVRAGGGVIVNLASIASLVGLEDRFAYSMTKGAVLAMTRSVAVDYMKANVRCNCICPARVHTPFVDGYLTTHYPGREAEMFRKLSEYQPMGRMAQPEEVAALALYLCSDEAAFVTGQAFPLDGGVLVH